MLVSDLICALLINRATTDDCWDKFDSVWRVFIFMAWLRNH